MENILESDPTVHSSFSVPLALAPTVQLTAAAQKWSEHRPNNPALPRACVVYCRDDDKEYMSSESSQRGSSMGDVTSNMSYDYSSSRSDVRPSIYDAAQGLAHLAMLACRERAPPYAGPEPESTMSRGYGHDRDHAPCQHTGHPENFHRDTSRVAAGREPSLPEFGKSGPSHHTKSSMVYRIGKLVVSCQKARSTDDLMSGYCCAAGSLPIDGGSCCFLSTFQAFSLIVLRKTVYRLMAVVNVEVEI